MHKPKLTKKPWGNEQLFALSSNYAGKILNIRKGHRLSLQYHKKKEESLFLLKGTLRLSIGIKQGKLTSRILRNGAVFHLPPLTIHRMEAISDCCLVEVSTPHLLDVIRLDDDYNRAKTASKQA